MTSTSINIGEAFSFAWRRFKDNAAFLLLLAFGLGVIVLIANLIHGASGSGVTRMFTYLIVLLADVVASFAMVCAAIDVHDRGKTDMAAITSSLPMFAPFLIGYVIFAVGVFLGFLLLIIPGVYLSVKLFLYMFFVVDRQVDGIEALKRSYEATGGVFWQLLLFGIVALLVNLVGALLFGIGLLVTVPLTVIAGAFIYRKLTS